MCVEIVGFSFPIQGSFEAVQLDVVLQPCVSDAERILIFALKGWQTPSMLAHVFVHLYALPPVCLSLSLCVFLCVLTVCRAVTV